jgi:hypothetical protein
MSALPALDLARGSPLQVLHEPVLGSGARMSSPDSPSGAALVASTGVETADGRRAAAPAGPGRQRLLEEGAAAVGAAWAQGLCSSIRREGRAIEGGWPGTRLEARARVAAGLADSLFRRGMSQLTGEELTRATEVTYARARQQWLEVERRAKLEARRGWGGQ